MKKEIIEEIKSIATYMDVDVFKDQIIFETRENGDVGEETEGVEDVREAYRVSDEINKLEKGLSPYVDIADEWVMVIANI